METDIPLKRLVQLRGADLLPLLGHPAATLLSAETVTLPSTEKRLDTILRLRSPGGQEYMLVVEWQGYTDEAILERLAFYVAWLAMHYPHLTVLGVVIYLHPGNDKGHMLRQMVDGQVMQQWQFASVQLWQQDARAAVASGNLGLAVLCPLMQGADDALVEQVAHTILQDTQAQEQAQLLSILGILSEELIDSNRFIRLIGKERLMKSKFIDYLFQEREQEMRTEFESRLVALEEQTQTRMQALEEQTRQTLTAALVQRFPDVPHTLIQDVEHIRDVQQLQALILALFQVADLDEFRQRLHQATGNGNGAGERSD